MAYPTVAGFGTGNGDGSSGNVSVDLTVAGTPAVGDLLVVIFAAATGNLSLGLDVFPSGWGFANQGGGAFSDYVVTTFGWRIVAPGDATTISVKMTGGSSPCVWHVYRIAAGTHDGVYPVGGIPIRYSTSTTPTAPTCTPFWPQEDTLWLAWAGFYLSQNPPAELSISSYPSNYTNGTLTTRIYTGLGYIHLGSCRRELNATSDTAGTFTISSAPTQSFTQRIAIAPARNVTAYPKVLGIVSGDSGGNVTNTPINIRYSVYDDVDGNEGLALNPQPGDLIVIAMCKDGTGTFTWPGTPSYTVLTNAAFQSAAAFTIGYRIHQSSDSTLFNISHANESVGYVALVIEKDTFASGTAPELAETNGSSTNPNPPSLNPTNWDVENTLWLAFAGNDGNVAITGAPSGFYGLVNGRVAASTGAGCAGAWLGESTSAKDPGTFTMSSEQWYAGTVGVRPTHAWVKSLYESPKLTDATVTTQKGEAGGSKTLTDTATLTATPTKGPGKNATETATLTGTVSKAIGIALLELLTLTDPTVTTSKASSYTKELTETVTLADTRDPFTLSRTLTESLTLTEPLDNPQRTRGWYHAASFAPDIGSVSGTIENTWREDASQLTLSEEVGTPGFNIEFLFGEHPPDPVPTSNVLLTLVGQYSGNAGHTVQVRQFDFVTGGGQWVDTGGRITDSASETTYRFYLSTDAKYLSNGRLYVSFYHSSSGNPTHQLIINHLFLSYRFDGTETATLTDTLTREVGYQRTLTETAVLTDLTLKTRGITFSNPVGIDDRLNVHKEPLTETATLVATVNPVKETKFPTLATETLTLADSATQVKPTFAETVGLTDTLRAVPAAQRLTETLALTDTWTKASAAARTLEEQLYSNDLELLQASITLYESASLADTPNKDWARTLTEGLTLADTLSARMGSVTLTETLGLADTASKGPARTWTEGTTLTATPIKGVGRTLSDAATVADGTLKRTAQGIHNDITLADSISTRAIGITLTETAILTDSVQNEWSGGANNYTKDLTESLLLSDVFDRTWTAARSYTEGATLADSATKGPGRTLSEGVTLTDSLVRLATAQRTLEEQLWTNDLELLQASITLKETLGLAATFERQAGRSRTITNYLYLSDAGLRVSDLGRADVATLSDAVTKDVSRDLSETVALSDSISNIHTPGTTGYTEDLTETTVLADSATKDTSRTLVETATLSDTRTGASSHDLTETVGLTDSSKKDTDRTWTEGVTLADTSTKSPARALTETAALTDTFSRQVNYQRTFTESAGLLDSLSQGNSETILNGVALTDTLTLQSDRYRTFTETATLADTIQKATGRTATELLTLTDSRGVSSLARTLSEQVTLTDQATKHPTRSINEIAYLTDSLDVSIGAAKVESLALTDSVRKDIARTLVETAGLVDLVNTGNSQTFLAGVTLADTVSKSASRTLTEGLTLLDTKVSGDQIDFEDPVSLTAAIRKDTGRALAEVVGLSDSLTTQANFSQIQSDVVVLSDTLETQFSGANHYTKELTEAATLIDSVSKAASRSLIEGVTLSDSHREDAARIHAEGLGLADTLTVESAGARLLTEGVTLSDSLTAQRKAINLLEQVVLGDVLQANRFRSKTLTESITLRHNPNSFGTSQPPNKGVGRTLAEGITVKDSWVHHKYETLVLTDTLERLRTHVLYQTPTLIDTLEVGYGDSSSQEDVVLVDEIRKDVARELTEGIAVRTAALAPDIYTEEQVLTFAG